jgi:hypothetical protein
MSSRNAVIVHVSERDFLTLFQGWKRYECLALPDLKACRDEAGCRQAIPEDAELERVHHDWHRRAFGLLFTHPSFPAVADGDRCPVWVATEVTVHALPVAEVRPDGVVVVERSA